MVVKVLDWRQLSKLKSTYTDALQAQINPATGRVHTSYSLTGAQTGRLSSTDPNLQNIPIRTEVGRQIRDAFVADRAMSSCRPTIRRSSCGWRRIWPMCRSCKRSLRTMAKTFMQPHCAWSCSARSTRDTRARAKTVNFSILYGISRWGLGGRLGDRRRTRRRPSSTRYFQRFPGIQRYIARYTRKRARRRAIRQTLFGRKTWFPRINAKNPNERAAASARRSTRRSRAPAQTSSNARWRG
jgi:DNA polymerase-1